MSYNPFDSLPDNPVSKADDSDPVVSVVAEPVVEYAPAKRELPKSVVSMGNNGNNMTVKEETFQAVMAKRKDGRMSTFTEEKAAVVIEGIEDGLTMDAIADKLETQRQTIWTWMQLLPWFKDAVAQAREYQGHSSADNAVKLLDEVTIDPDNPKAAMAELRKAEQRARIRMDLAKAFNFKQYGDKKQNLNLNVNAEVSPVDLSNFLC